MVPQTPFTLCLVCPPPPALVGEKIGQKKRSPGVYYLA